MNGFWQQLLRIDAYSLYACGAYVLTAGLAAAELGLLLARRRMAAGEAGGQESKAAGHKLERAR